MLNVATEWSNLFKVLLLQFSLFLFLQANFCNLHFIAETKILVYLSTTNLWYGGFCCSRSCFDDEFSNIEIRLADFYS